MNVKPFRSTLAFESYGFGPRTIVFLHGWGGSREIWRPIVEMYASKYRCVLVDLWGHGESSLPMGEYGPDFVTCLSDVLRKSGDTRAIVVAHSMGSLLALDWASVCPDEVDGVVLVEGIYPRREMFASSGGTKSPAEVTRLFRWMVSPHEEEPWARAIVECAAVTSENGLAFYEPSFSRDRIELLNRTRQPRVLISREAFGGRRISQSEFVERGVNANVSVRVVPNSSTHFVMAERAEEFRDVLDQALDEVNAAIAVRVKEQAVKYFAAQAHVYARSSAHNEKVDDVMQFIECASNLRIVDLGTGTGSVAMTLGVAGHHVVAIDPCQTMIDVASKRAHDGGLSANIEFVVAEAAALPVPDGSIDAVVTRLAAHHFWDLPGAIGEVRRVLKPGGTFVLVDNIGPESRNHFCLIERLERLKDASHARLYSLGEWLVILARAGLDVRHCSVVKGMHAFEDWASVASMSEDDRERVQELWRMADETTREYFRCEELDGRLVSFAIDRITLMAKRSRHE